MGMSYEPLCSCWNGTRAYFHAQVLIYCTWCQHMNTNCWDGNCISPPPKKKLQNKTITHRKRKHESHTSQVGIHLPLISLLILRMSCTACGGEKKTERSHKFGWRRECLHHPRDGIKWCFRHRVVWFWVHFTCFYFCSNPVSGQLP